MKQRASQVAEELRKIISMILLDDLNDPRMGFVTVTQLEVTDDLKYGQIGRASCRERVCQYV